MEDHIYESLPASPSESTESGAVTTIDENSQLVKFTVKIPNFRPNHKGFSKIITSDVIEVGYGLNASKWILQVNGMSQDVEIYLSTLTLGEFDASFEIVMHTSQMCVFASKQHRQVFNKATNKFHRLKVVKKSLFEAIMPDYILNIACTINVKPLKMYEPNPVNSPVNPKLLKILQNDFHDLKILVNGVSLDAHKCLVSAYSPVLHQELLKIKDSTLEISEFDATTIWNVLEFIYGRKLDLNSSHVAKILLASKKYEIEDLQKKCENFMVENLSLNDALEILSFADTNGLASLFGEIIKYSIENVDVLINSYNWENFTKNHPVTFKKLFQQVLQNSKKVLTKYFEVSSWFDPNQASSTDAGKSNVRDNDFEKLFRTSAFSDVEFEIEGKVVKAHKSILSCRSKVFESMFKHETDENRKNQIKIEDSDHKTIEDMVSYIYSGKVANLKENSVNLFIAADKYDLEDLRKLCKDEMTKNMTINNITEILKVADLHESLEKLKMRASRFVFANFQRLFEMQKWSEFAEQNPQILNELLKEWVKI